MLNWLNHPGTSVLHLWWLNISVYLRKWSEISGSNKAGVFKVIWMHWNMLLYLEWQLYNNITRVLRIGALYEITHSIFATTPWSRALPSSSFYHRENWKTGIIILGQTHTVSSSQGVRIWIQVPCWTSEVMSSMAVIHWLWNIPCLYSNKLVCHKSTDAGKGHRTPGPETKGRSSVMAMAITRVSAFTPVP